MQGRAHGLLVQSPVASVHTTPLPNHLPRSSTHTHYSHEVTAPPLVFPLEGAHCSEASGRHGWEYSTIHNGLFQPIYDGQNPTTPNNSQHTPPFTSLFSR